VIGINFFSRLGLPHCVCVCPGYGSSVFRYLKRGVADAVLEYGPDRSTSQKHFRPAPHTRHDSAINHGTSSTDGGRVLVCSCKRGGGGVGANRFGRSKGSLF